MPINIFSLLNNIILARALFVAAELNISEHLEQQAMPVNELATKIHAHEQALSRLLYFLELHDVYIKDANGKYHNSEFSKTMCADHPHTIKPFLLHDDETRWNSFGHLGNSIKTGKAAFDELYGTDYFSYLKNHPKLSVRFDEAMTIISAQEDESIAKTITFQGTVADIGGGKGQLLNKILQYNPSVKGILFDLPEVIKHTDNAPKKYTTVAGSFFEPIALKADIFILKRILHDWNNDKALQILKHVSLAMGDSSKLYIIDGILDQSKNKKLLAAVDLALLAIFQGQERALHDISELLQKANLEIVQVIQINDLICAIECKKSS